MRTSTAETAVHGVAPGVWNTFGHFDDVVEMSVKLSGCRMRTVAVMMGAGVARAVDSLE